MFASLSSADPPPSARRHWRQLLVLLKHSPDAARAFLRRPPPGCPPPSGEVEQLARLAKRVGLGDLLEKHLLASLLLAPPDKRPADTLDGRGLIDHHIPGVDPAPLLARSWLAVPVVTVQGGRGKVVTLLLALLPPESGPNILGRPAPDRRAGEALATGCRVVAPDKGWAGWFVQAGDDPPVQGESLALAAALGFSFLARSMPWPVGLYATGALDPVGRIRPVRAIREKSAAAMPRGLFLVPADGQVLPLAGDLVHPCASFDDAWFAAALYSGGIHGGDIGRWLVSLRDVPGLLSAFADLPPALIEHERVHDLLARAAEKPEQYLDQLRKCLDRCAHAPRRGQIIAGLFTPEGIRSLAGQQPELDYSAFNWCLAATALYNHCGLVEKSRSWQECARSLHSLVDPSDIARSVNHFFVSDRFNRYDFRPEPPPRFAELLQQEEKRQRHFPESNYLLGAMYGTLAQNFGFLGPEHLHGLLTMTARAWEAFGRKFDREKERLRNYEIYGYLDGGRINKARQLLAAYLDLETFSPSAAWREAARLLRDPARDAPFRAALALRLLAALAWKPPAAELAPLVPALLKKKGHPWQLICLNLGRMALGDGEISCQAEELLRASLRICLEDTDTMRPMALLALSELHAAGLARAGDLRQTLEITAWIGTSGAINKNHFRAILDTADAGAVLNRVHEQRGRLFPFSYR